MERKVFEKVVGRCGDEWLEDENAPWRVCQGVVCCAGNPGDRRRLHDHFAVFIPSWTVKSALTNSNWEGVGITPQIYTPQKNALEVAYAEALKKIEKALEHLSDVPSTFKKEVRDARQALAEKQ